MRIMMYEEEKIMTLGELIDSWSNDTPDMDVFSDYADDLIPAYCGTQLTEKGKERYRSVLALEVEVVNGEIWVKVENGREHNSVIKFFSDAAGYISEDEYDEYFRDTIQEVFVSGVNIGENRSTEYAVTDYRLPQDYTSDFPISLSKLKKALQDGGFGSVETAVIELCLTRAYPNVIE